MISKTSYKYCTIPLEMNMGETKKPLRLKFNARMKIFHHESNNTYLLGVTIPEDLLETFERFESRINDLAFEKKIRNKIIEF